MERIGTGVDDLDLILGGGLPYGSLIFIAGGSGTGKTILAQQICFANGTRDRKALYYTMVSEPHAKLVRHLSSSSSTTRKLSASESSSFICLPFWTPTRLRGQRRSGARQSRGWPTRSSGRARRRSVR